MQSSAVNVDVFMIAIAGCSCSGKSTVAREIVATDEHSLLIHQDDYYKPAAPKTEDGLDNWDVLEALNTDQLIHAVREVVENPLKHCSTCLTTAVQGRNRGSRRHTVYIEGTMMLDISILNELLHLKIFITLDYDECLKRRQQRWKDYVDPPGFFDGCVWPMYLKREKMSQEDPSVNVIDGHQSKEKIRDAIRTLTKVQVN